MAAQRRLARLLQLASLIESGAGLSVRQIAESYRVSRRTILRDVRALQAAGMSIETRGIEGGYRLFGASVHPVPLTNDEAVAILLAAAPLCNSEPLSGPLQRAIARILRQVSPAHREELSRIVYACTQSP
ncbi:MAG TPA: HTH domain-containing protein, partial [Pirellulales bacterium]